MAKGLNPLIRQLLQPQSQFLVLEFLFQVACDARNDVGDTRDNICDTRVIVRDTGTDTPDNSYDVRTTRYKNTCVKYAKRVKRVKNVKHVKRWLVAL